MNTIARKWVKTFDMAVMLGMSPIALLRKAQKDRESNAGYLIKGVHYNQLGDKNSPFYWNVELTLQAFENWGAPISGATK